MQQRSSMQENQPPDEADIFDRYGSLVFAYIRKHVSIQEDAEDLTLEVFTAALENPTICTISLEEQLAWLKKVTHNKLIDRYRRAQHRIHVQLDHFAETLYDYKEPEEILLQREINDQLHHYIQQLSPLHQHILYLRYAHGLNSHEIGSILNKSADVVRQQLARARNLLRTSYQGQEKKGV